MIISDILTAFAVVVLFVVWLYFPRTVAVGLGLAYSIIAKKIETPSSGPENAITWILFLIGFCFDVWQILNSPDNKNK
jgi:hypothetical protein